MIRMEEEFEVYKLREEETLRKIKTTHELVKTVMNLHHEDINCFEESSRKNSHTQKNFSFDISKTLKESDKEQVVIENSGDKEKIIIKEPLEVFEIENDNNKDSRFSSGLKDSQKDQDSQSEEQILKAYIPSDDSQGSRNQENLPNVFMSPKFKSFEDNGN